MANAYGFIEITGVVAATDALDIMCKAANVQFVTWERKLGGRLVTIIIEGNVSAVNEAIAAASASCIKKPVTTAILARPHPETIRLVTQSAKKVRKRGAEIGKQQKTKTRRKNTNQKGGKKDVTGSIGDDRNPGSDSGN